MLLCLQYPGYTRSSLQLHRSVMDRGDAAGGCLKPHKTSARLNTHRPLGAFDTTRIPWAERVPWSLIGTYQRAPDDPFLYPFGPTDEAVFHEDRLPEVQVRIYAHNTMLHSLCDDIIVEVVQSWVN